MNDVPSWYKPGARVRVFDPAGLIVPRGVVIEDRGATILVADQGRRTDPWPRSMVMPRMA